MALQPTLLRQIALLADLPDEILATLATQLHIKEYKKNETVVLKGQPSSELFFLFKGRLKVVDYSENGKEIAFMHINAGSHFGELALIDSKPRSASIVTTEPSMVAYLPSTDAKKLMYTNPSVSEKLLTQLASIIRQNNERIMLLGSASATNRINILLLKYAKQDDQNLIIEKLPTQNEIATMTNTTRETVSRTLAQLTEKGLIKKEGKRIIIISPKELEKLNRE